jgi:polysaccharide pyruvyl transferase WcaK-like protein
MKTEKSMPTYVLLGASLDTGNLGVNALLASSIKGILQQEPEARFMLFEGRPDGYTDQLSLCDGKTIRLGCLGIRRNKTIWRNNHVLRLFFMVLVGSLIVIPSWRRKWLQKNPCIHKIMSAHCVMDITGGDSFSDIYGLPRMLINSLFKIVIILTGTGYVLLPQTYGPFRHILSRLLGRWIIRRVDAIYCRDQEGLSVIQNLTGGHKMKSVPQFCPDVAFLLDSIPPQKIEFYPANPNMTAKRCRIGFNISGLLYSGGYNQQNMFGLKWEYKDAVIQIIDGLLTLPDTEILLISHVFPDSRFAVESDPVACQMVYEQIKDAYPGRLYCLAGSYDQSEIKYIIGQCDFFIGSRMHACIAAISQGIPAIGLAYSKKFKGVYESAGIPELVIDARAEALPDVLNKVLSKFMDRSRCSEKLGRTIPELKKQLNEMFRGICAMPKSA